MSSTLITHPHHPPPSGCLFAELCTGQPLFPGESDVDQLWHIVRALGALPHCFAHCRGGRHGVSVRGMREPRNDERMPLDGRRLPQMSNDALQLLQVGLLGGGGEAVVLCSYIYVYVCMYVWNTLHVVYVCIYV